MNKINEECERKGIPYAIGKRIKWASVSPNYTKIRW
jgi:hypothetical protein